MPAMMPGSQGAVIAQNVPYAEAPPPIPVAPEVIDISKIDPREVTSLVDNGELPSKGILSAIFSASAELGEKIPPEIRDLKTHLLNRILKHKGLIMKALETKEDAVVNEILDAIKDEGPEEEGDKEKADEKDDDPLFEKVPRLPLTVGFDPMLQKPQPSFFGATGGWFGGLFGGWFGRSQNKPDTNVGNFLDNRRAAHNSFEREGSGWGRSTVYYPPLTYSAHLIPVTSGAFDLKTMEFRPYRDGHPRITRRRMITRIILRKDPVSPGRHPPKTRRGRGRG